MEKILLNLFDEAKRKRKRGEDAHIIRFFSSYVLISDGKVLKVNVLDQSLVIDLEEGRRTTLPLADVKKKARPDEHKKGKTDEHKKGKPDEAKKRLKANGSKREEKQQSKKKKNKDKNKNKN